MKHSGLRNCLNNCNCNLSKIEHLSNIDDKFERKYLKAKIKDEFQDIVSVHEGKKLFKCDKCDDETTLSKATAVVQALQETHLITTLFQFM